MQKIKLLSCLLLMGISSFAQDQNQWESIFPQINKEVLANSKAYATLGAATKIIGHRLTGSENGAKAEQFAYDLLKRYGFTDLRFQPFEVESWSRGTLSVQVGPNGTEPTTYKSVSLAHSPVQSNINLELVDMGNGLEEDYAAAPDKAKGKIALVYLGVLPGSKPGTQTLHRSEKTAIAINHGAKGIVVINTAENGILLTGTASVTGKLIPIPAVCISKEDGMALRSKLKAAPQWCHIQMTNNAGLIKARNVIATIEGSKYPNEKVIVGGHLDSWDLATGAIDNGIGSFAVLDMARTFKALNLKPARTVEFVMFMGEEQGLLGSKAYVKEAVANGSIDNIRYMLNFDMTYDPKYFNTTAEESKDLFQKISGIIQKMDTSFKDQFAASAGLHSDHQPFMLHGVPTAGGSGGGLPNNAGPCYHADCDDFKLVEDRGLRNTVQYGSMLLYGIADAPELKAKHKNDIETRDFLFKNNLKEPLQLAGEWRWK